MQEKQPAPSFALPDQHGQQHTLDEYNGKWLVLYFYPGDETPGCTKEACAFRDGRKDLIAAGAEAVGVSKDSVESHQKFDQAHDLDFTLLSDESTETIRAYDAWGQNKSGEGVLRVTYLIDPRGNIAKVYRDVDPAIHTPQVLKDIQALSTAS